MSARVGHRHRGTWRRAGLAVSIALTALVGPMAPALVPAALAAEGSFVSGATTYLVQPGQHRVHVRVDLRIRNDTPDRRQGDVILRTSLKGWGIAVQDQAVDVRATSAGQRLATDVRDRGDFKTVKFDLRPRLSYGQTAAVRVDYDLPDGGPRSSSPIRVGRAFATFVAFAHGDDRATVKIVLPPGFDVETDGGSVETTSDPAGITLSSSDSVDDLTWYVRVTADRPAELERSDLSVPVDGRPRAIELRSWPEDEDWARTVAAKLTRGLPALGDLIGLPWPVSGPLEVTEAYTPSLGGYAGFYTPGEGSHLDEIKITEEPDPLVILHEASHAWFNPDLFQGRWINEGLADEYASRAMVVIGERPDRPDLVRRDDRAAFPLDAWAPPGRIDDKAAEAREAYGYAASLSVIHALVEEIGLDGMRAVFAAAAGSEIAYVGRPAPERDALSAAGPDWRYLLDLLEQRGGSDRAADLFGTWVLADSLRPLLAERAAAETAYADLLRHGGGWLPGKVIRAQMTRWLFDSANGQMAQAEAVLDDRDAKTVLEAALGVDDGGRLQARYEAASVSLADSAVLAQGELEALESMRLAKASVDAERGPLVVIGLIGADPAAGLSAGRAAYLRGDLEGARQAVDDARALVESAGEVGTQRAASGSAAVVIAVAIGGGAFVLVRRRRRARRDAAEPVLSAVGLDLPPATLADQSMTGAPTADPAQAASVETEERP